MRFTLLLCIFLGGCSSCKVPPDGTRAAPSASVAPSATRAELRVDRGDGFADVDLLGQGTVEMSSIDGHGDTLLEVLATEYDAGTARRMKRRIKVPITILGGSVANISKEPLRAKAFLDDGHRESYAELYVNFDPMLRVLQIHEKDGEYRGNFLRALSE